LVSPIEFAPKGLVCFDFDSVLSPKEIINELADFVMANSQISKITNLAMNGHIDYKSSLEKRVHYLRGLNINKLIELGKKIPITAGAKQVIEFLIKKRILPVIISGGFMEVIKVANYRLGIPLIIANRLKVKNQLLTGRVYGNCLTAEAKGEILAYLIEKFQIPMKKTAAVCDGANDINLLRKVNLPIGFRPKEKIKEHIKYRSFNDMREILGYLLIEGFFD
jgi:phosphoserine phosphatase